MKKNLNKEAIVIIGGFFLVVFGLVALQPDDDELVQANEVISYEIQKQQYTDTLDLHGKVESQQSVLLTSKKGGEISLLHADIGDVVYKDQLLASLDADTELIQMQIAFSEKQDLVTIFQKQSDLLDEQIRSAEKQVEIAEVAYQTAKEQSANGVISFDEQIKLAESQVDAAEIAVANVRSLNERRLEAVYGAVESAIRQSLIIASDITDFAEALLVSETNYKGLNADFGGVLGILDQQALTAAKNQYDVAANAKDIFKDVYDTHIVDGNPSTEDYDDYLTDAEDVLHETQLLLDTLFTALVHTPVTGKSSQETIDAFKNQVLLLGTQSEQALLSYQSGARSGVTGLLLSIADVKTQNASELASVESALAQQQQALEQIKASSRKGVVSEGNQVDLAQKQLEQTMIAVSSLKLQKQQVLADLTRQLNATSGYADLQSVNVQDTKLFSPFDGVITEKHGEVGQSIQMGQVVYTLANMDSVKVIVDIPDRYYQQLHTGLKARLTFPGSDEVVYAVLDKIYPTVNPVSHKVQVEFIPEGLHKKDLLLGLYVDVELDLEEKETYFIPRSFLQISEEGVFVKTDVGEMIQVNIGREEAEMIEISSEQNLEFLRIVK